MRGVYRGLDSLRVDLAKALEKKAVAKFNCPMCGQEIEMIFTREDVKALMEGLRK